MAKKSNRGIKTSWPIKSKRDIREIRKLLYMEGDDVFNNKHRLGRRNLMLFDLGINCGLRISDIVRLRVHDVDKPGRIDIQEQKTGKESHAVVSKQLAKEVQQYAAKMHLKPDDYMFPSRKRDKDGNVRPITKTQAYRFLRHAGKMQGLKHFSCHSLRKTFGWWYFENGGRIEELSYLLNHDSVATTRRYLGLSQDDVDKKMQNFYI